MNEKERTLLHYVCNGDLKKAQQEARLILESLTSKKDERMKENLLKTLDSKKGKFIELPYNIKDLLLAEDVSNFAEEKYLLRDEEKRYVDKVLGIRKVSEKLGEMGISYVPSIMLYGESGTGKTMLARYIAYKADLPFIYVKFSNMVSSYLGSTQSNIGKVFEFARTSPCVLCFDEIDAVGMARGQKNDVGEMNRIVIALMQELDNLPNDVIFVGTTNRFDRLDDALIRRFTMKYEVRRLEKLDIIELVKRFFKYSCNYENDKEVENWCSVKFEVTETASTVVNTCISEIVNRYISEI